MVLTWQEMLLPVVTVLLLIAINAFFVTAEFAMVAVRRSRINQLVDAGDVQAKTVQDLQRSINRLLSTTQLGITLSSLALGWIGESALSGFIRQWLEQFSLSGRDSTGLANSLAIPVTFVLLAYLQIVLGELCPKTVALLHAEQLARFLGGPSTAIARLFSPFIWGLNQSTRLILQLFGIRYRPDGWDDTLTPEELQRILVTSQSTSLEAEERALLRNVFEFGEVTAGEVMTPRPSIVALARDATFKEVLEEVVRSGHSRFPVIGESLDDVQGVLNFQELAEPLATETFDLERTIEPWVRPVRFVVENTPLNELLPQIQRSGQPMTIVVDEYGGTAGLVTLEDLIAEIMGDIAESPGTEVPNFQVLDAQTFMVQAQMNLEEVNEMLGLDLPLADNYQTLAGFLIYQVQKIPTIGEQLFDSDCEFTIISAEGPRLDRIQIRRLEETPPLATDRPIVEATSSDGSDRPLPPEDLLP
jgi:CBS domain containing-hemolysin-like protein